MFQKILVANRGEIACRVIRACREMGIKSVAIYSKVDQDSLHAKIADEAICIGDASNTESYLHMSNVLMAAEMSKADAVHPGYGYFSERAHFVDALETLGIKFIGPSSRAMESMGDKALAKQVAIEVGCPVVPGSSGPVHTEAEGLQIAESIGYPVLLKAVAGGGGRGIRRVDGPDDLTRQWKTAQAEAQASFGNGDLIVEKCLIEPRHIEFQILGDEQGNIVYLGERECSVQNLRHQKIIEEAPYAHMTPALRKKMGEAAVKIAKSVDYANAGTIEFLLDKDLNFYFLEMNTRLQVEHPITEEVTGLDLVKLQLKIAMGETLPFIQEDIQIRGYAIEARITAQDPEKEFAPCTGKINVWNAPGGKGVRLDTHIYAGFTITPYYDPMIAKLIVYDRTREAAIQKLQSALHEFHVEGISTNIPFLRQLVQNEDYRRAEVSTAFVGQLLQEASVGV